MMDDLDLLGLQPEQVIELRLESIESSLGRSNWFVASE